MFEDEDGRRPGDWTHRAQRQRQANTIVGKDDVPADQQKKWYHETFWIIFFLVVLWPVGLYCMWRSDWNTIVKVVVTIVVAIIVAIAFSMSMQVNAMMSQ